MRTGASGEPSIRREELGEAGFALWSYWLTLRGDALAPPREALDPMALARHLPVVSLIEREAPMVWRIRLVGTEIVRRSGDLKGRNFIELLAAEQREREDRRLTVMVTRPCGSYGIRENVRPDGYSYFVRTVSLPLWSTDGERRFVIATNEELNRERFPVSAQGLSELRVERKFLDIGSGVADAIE